MEDVEFKWMQGDGEARPWLCPIYGMSTELEICDLLYSLVKLIRPKRIVETGCHLGIGTYALGKAAKEVGGSVVSCDIDHHFCITTVERCNGLPVWVSVTPAERLVELASADFVFLDASEESRIACVPKLRSGAIGVMHDTRHEAFLREAFSGVNFVHLESWRGATIFQKS